MPRALASAKLSLFRVAKKRRFSQSQLENVLGIKDEIQSKLLKR
jgi:hypothetical protein